MISSEELKEAYLLGKKEGGVLTLEMLRKKGYDESKILSIFNKLVENKICSLHKSSSSNSSIFCKLRIEKSISQLQQLDANDYKIYCTIEEAGNKGIWTADIRKITNLQPHQIQKSVKQLCEILQLIKPVKNIHVKNRKVYMLTELEPAKEIAGGSFYVSSEFNFELVEHLRERISYYLKNGKTADLATIAQFIRSSGGLKNDISDADISIAIKSLQLDEKVVSSSSDQTIYLWNRWPNIYSIQAFPEGKFPSFLKNEISSNCDILPKWLNYSNDVYMCIFIYI